MPSAAKDLFSTLGCVIIITHLPWIGQSTVCMLAREVHVTDSDSVLKISDDGHKATIPLVSPSTSVQSMLLLMKRAFSKSHIGLKSPLRVRIWRAGLLSALLAASLICSALSAEPKRILVLHSFGRDFRPWREYAIHL